MADFVDAFNARDLERTLARVAPEFVMEMPPGTVVLRGREALRAVYGALFERSPDLRVEVLARFRVGQWVVEEHRLTGWNLEPVPPEHVADIYHVVDGQIVRALILA